MSRNYEPLSDNELTADCARPTVMYQNYDTLSAYKGGQIMFRWLHMSALRAALYRPMGFKVLSASEAQTPPRTLAILPAAVKDI